MIWSCSCNTLQSRCAALGKYVFAYRQRLHRPEVLKSSSKQLAAGRFFATTYLQSSWSRCGCQFTGTSHQDPFSLIPVRVGMRSRVQGKYRQPDPSALFFQKADVESFEPLFPVDSARHVNCHTATRP